MSAVRAESDRKLSGVRAKSLTCVSAGASSRVSAPTSHAHSLGINHADNQPSSPQFHISENAGGRERVTKRIGPLTLSETTMAIVRGELDPPVNPTAATRRNAVVGVCPACAGMGFDRDEDLNEIECVVCHGDGDLDRARLSAAYELGRADALEQANRKLDELERMVQVVREIVNAPRKPESYRAIRQRIGG